MSTPATAARAQQFVVLADRAKLWVYALALTVAAAAFIHWDTAARPNWSNDGYTYAIRMMTDRGVPYEQARADARAWYADKPPMRDPRFVTSYNARYPEYWSLFGPRLLYPWIASFFAERMGMEALLTVSNIAYVLALLAIFLFVYRYTSPESALVLTAACAFFPEMRLMGRAPLTDMLAVALWAWTLLAMARYVLELRTSWFAAYAAAATLMSLTRPIPYMPLVAALVLFFIARMRGDAALQKAAFALGGVALMLCVVVTALGMTSGAPSFAWVLEHIRVGSRLVPHASLAAWYGVRIAVVTAESIVALLAFLAPPIAFLALWANRMRPDIAICLGAVASTVLTIVVNPITSDIPRVVVLPLLPIVAAGLALYLPRKSEVPV